MKTNFGFNLEWRVIKFVRKIQGLKRKTASNIWQYQTSKSQIGNKYHKIEGDVIKNCIILIEELLK